MARFENANHDKPCSDCGVCAPVLVVGVTTFAGKRLPWRCCPRCYFKRGDELAEWTDGSHAQA